MLSERIPWEFRKRKNCSGLGWTERAIWFSDLESGDTLEIGSHPLPCQMLLCCFFSGSSGSEWFRWSCCNLSTSSEAAYNQWLSLWGFSNSSMERKAPRIASGIGMESPYTLNCLSGKFSGLCVNHLIKGHGNQSHRFVSHMTKYPVANQRGVCRSFCRGHSFLYSWECNELIQNRTKSLKELWQISEAPLSFSG